MSAENKYTRVWAQVFTLGGEPGLSQHFDESYTFDAASEREYQGGGSTGAITQMTAQLSLKHTGLFALTVKTARDLAQTIAIDDWIALFGVRDDIEQLFFLGRIKLIQRLRQAPEGALEVDWLLEGKGFGSIFEDMPLYFDVFTDGADAPFMMQKLVFGAEILQDDIARVVEALLAGFTRGLAKKGRSLFPIPMHMTLRTARDPDVPIVSKVPDDELLLDPRPRFPDAMAFYDIGYSRLIRAWSPISFSFGTSPNEDLLTFTRRWSEPLIHELYFDLLIPVASAPAQTATMSVEAGDEPQFKVESRRGKQVGFDYYVGGLADIRSDGTPADANATGAAGGPVALLGSPAVGSQNDQSIGAFEYILPGTRVALQDIIPAVVFRDRPWFDSQPTPGSDPPSYSHPYLDLPVVELDETEITRGQLGARGDLLSNAFFVNFSYHPDLAGDFFRLSGTTWDRGSIMRHGLQRFEGRSAYIPNQSRADFLEQVTRLRWRVRDLHCLDHLLTTGTIRVDTGRVDIRPGVRIRIHNVPTDDRTGVTEESYYVEDAQHVQTIEGGGVMTTLGVSRGFRGTDEELLALFHTVVARYGNVIPTSGETVPDSEALLAMTVQKERSVQTTPFSKEAQAVALPAQDRIAPGTPEFNAAFLAAAVYDKNSTSSIDGAAWLAATATDLKGRPGKALEILVGYESDGYVGRPNFTIPGAADPTAWPEIVGKARVSMTQNPWPGRSSAIGIGQLSLSNYDACLTTKRTEIGQTVPECAAMLQYIYQRYRPFAASVGENPARVAALVWGRNKRAVALKNWPTSSPDSFPSFVNTPNEGY